MTSFRIALLFGTALLLIVFNSVSNANAGTLKEEIHKLDLLQLHYGTNNIKINNEEVLIVKGAFVSETGWGGDGYTILVHQDQIWQLARMEEGLGNETTIWTTPHTQEDAITSVYFLRPKITKNPSYVSDLYLLVSHRHYHDTPLDLVPAKFTLYVLQRNDDFGIYYFRKLNSEISKVKYCNADSAAHHELGIPLPGDGKEFPCALQK